MEEELIKKVDKVELEQSIEQIVQKVESIALFIQEFEKNKQSIIESNEKINGENGLTAQIINKSQEVDNIYNKIFVDNVNNNSVKTQLEKFVAEIETNKNKIEESKNDIFGTDKTPGLLGQINDFYKQQEERYKVLYQQIEAELKAGTTSVNLSKSFADKVKEYRWNSWLWSVCFVLLVVGLVVYYGVITFSIADIKTTQDVWRHLASRAPFIIFAVWLAIFFGNRRAESKKLEELYKHKEVMARSFVGYKRTLEELHDEDLTLLKQHMENLLKAINNNSAIFLNSEGDKHPIFEILASCFQSKKGTTKDVIKED